MSAGGAPLAPATAEPVGIENRRLCPSIEGEVQFFLRAYLFLHDNEPVVSLLVASDPLMALLAYCRLREWRGYDRRAMADYKGGGEVELVVVGRQLPESGENLLAGRARFVDVEGFVLGRIATRFRSSLWGTWTAWLPMQYAVLFAVSDRQFEKCNGDFERLASEHPPRVLSDDSPDIEHRIMAWPTKERPTSLTCRRVIA